MLTRHGVGAVATESAIAYGTDRIRHGGLPGGLVHRRLRVGSCADRDQDQTAWCPASRDMSVIGHERPLVRAAMTTLFWLTSQRGRTGKTRCALLSIDCKATFYQPNWLQFVT